jgi:DNA-directed RNA polymerase specialized sigma24 family protein
MRNQPHSPKAPANLRNPLLTEIIDRHRAALLAQAARHAPRAADAEDAVQEACAAFLARYDGPAGTDALRWLMLVTKRCAWRLGEEGRRHGVLAELSVTDDEGVDERAVLAAGAAREATDPAVLHERRRHDLDLLGELAALKPDERTAVVLLGAGYGYAEIADRRRWSHTKVNRCVAEGRAALPSYRA